MAITYPTALDAFTNPTGTSLLTSPNHAQQHSDLNDAVEALEAKVAIGATVLGAWIDYTPTWTATGGVNPVIGNGSITGRYSLVNKTVTAQINILMGSTTTYGVGNFLLSLPVTAATTLAGYACLGSAWYFDSSASNSFTGIANVNAGSTTIIGLRFTGGGAGNVTPTAPFTFANTDFITVTLQYKAA